jgi:hypothetical protein
VLSTPLSLAFFSSSWYGLLGALLEWSLRARAICCLRSTPTAPALVVLTVSQPAIASSDAASVEMIIFFMLRM